MNNPTSVELKSLDLVYLTLLLIAVGLVSGFSFFSQEPASDQKKALRRAENLALQLKQIRKQNLARSQRQNSSGEAGKRTPASLAGTEYSLNEILKPFKKSGEIGSDPWGQPFQYDTFIHREATYLLIWSAGRDGQASSDAMELLLAAVEKQDPPYGGDDLGLVVTLEP